MTARRLVPFAGKSYALAKSLGTYQHEYAVGYP
jgi:hypothetical protein